MDYVQKKQFKNMFEVKYLRLTLSSNFRPFLVGLISTRFQQKGPFAGRKGDNILTM